MLKHYLLIAWRSLKKNRLFTFLNAIGLASGIAVALLLMLYAKDELSFDKYHSKASLIYRVGLTATFDNKSERWANTPNVTGPAMKAEIPEVEEQARLLYHDYGKTAFVNTADKKFSEKKLYWADGSLFKIFDIKFLRGNPAEALNDPKKIVLSKSTAYKYFGKEDPIGKLVKVDNKYELEVSGVYEDFPGNSTIDAELIGSFSAIEWANKNLVWSNASYETYILVKPNSSPASIEQKLKQIVDKNVAKNDQWFSFWLQPLTDIHLGSGDITNSSTTRVGDASQVKILIILAIVVLLIASINYMNLATARSQMRFKEVSINKTVGASKFQLAGRFYLETALLLLIAIFISIGILAAGLPLFNRLAEKSLSFNSIFSVDVIGGLLIMAVLIILIAGSYPAFYLSSFRPKELLHTTFRKSSGAGLFRRSLVVVQFVASVVLIISTVIFFQQLKFIQNKKLGYEPTQVVAITTAAAQNALEIESLINAYKSHSTVVDVCRAQTYPGNGGSGRTIYRPDNLDKGAFIRTNRVTSEFVKVLGLKLLAGNTLPAIKSDKDTTVQVVLNKEAVDFMGYTPEQAIGKEATNLFWEKRTIIVGVVDNFHFESFHKPIGAYGFHNNDSEWRPYLLVKTTTANLSKTMEQLESVFRKQVPNSAFEFTFIDQFLNTLYKKEQNTAQVVLVFSGLAILIACLGLFGLASFTAEQRTKEIGIRKVLGASLQNVVGLLSKDFLKLVLIASLIAVPVAWYMMQEWLKDFAYRVQLSWWVFAIAVLAALFVALITVSFQAIKAAVSNPVNSLRSE